MVLHIAEAVGLHIAERVGLRSLVGEVAVLRNPADEVGVLRSLAGGGEGRRNPAEEREELRNLGVAAEDRDYGAGHKGVVEAVDSSAVDMDYEVVGRTVAVVAADSLGHSPAGAGTLAADSLERVLLNWLSAT